MFVFGSATVEPEGMDLRDERWEAPCPRCGKAADHGYLERAEGSINVYRTIACGHCGHHAGFDWLNP